MKKLESIVLLSAILISSASYGRGLIRSYPIQETKNSDYRTCFREACKTEYVSDGENDEDYWQTPKETRIRGKGDCEDMSFDLYDRFKKSGIKSRPVIGIYKDEKNETGHMWIESEIDGEMMIFDPSIPKIFKKKETKFFNELDSEVDKEKIREFIKKYKNQERKIESFITF